MIQILHKKSSNIALIKYWGKQNNQLPLNPSISITLTKAFTETQFSFKQREKSVKWVDFSFEGQPNSTFATRVLKYFETINDYIPVLKDYFVKIESKNSFPHSSGIASSASSFAAIAGGLVDFEQQVAGHIVGFENAEQKTSFLARLGSGSAARSIYPGYVLWGKSAYLKGSSDDYAIPINALIHNDFKRISDAILLVSKSEKKVSSSMGHKLMENHPFARRRFELAKDHIHQLLQLLQQGDWTGFVDLVELEALTLHAMMMTSSPSYLLMEPNTLTILQKIREFRHDTQIPVCFTLDAGANVHLLYPTPFKSEVHPWIIQSLLPFCQQNQWIDDEILW